LYYVVVISFFSEGNDVAVTQFNRENLLPVICAILDPVYCDYDLKVAVCK